MTAPEPEAALEAALPAAEVADPTIPPPEDEELPLVEDAELPLEEPLPVDEEPVLDAELLPVLEPEPLLPLLDALPPVTLFRMEPC